jgi:hypothetical protein
MGTLTGIRPLLIEESVAMDFGRITISGGWVIYLFGMPGQERFWFIGTTCPTAPSGPSSRPTSGAWLTASRP